MIGRVLQRHQGRRERGEATLTVLRRREPWMRWARSVGRSVVPCTHSFPTLAALQAVASTSPQATALQRRVAVQGLSGGEGHLDSAGTVAVGVAPGELDPDSVAELLRRAARLPAVLVDWLERAPTEADLKRLARACLDLPILPVAVVVTAEVTARWLSGPPTVASALVREGLVREGKARSAEEARSRAEQMLFEALESHPRTRGAFQLNVRGVFALAGRDVEIDLFSAQHRVAVEVDGYFHFLDAEAYRRDRQKDVAYQQRGILVLRCLAEDVETDAVAVVRRIARLIETQEEGT